MVKKCNDSCWLAHKSNITEVLEWYGRPRRIRCQYMGALQTLEHEVLKVRKTSEFLHNYIHGYIIVQPGYEIQRFDGGGRENDSRFGPSIYVLRSRYCKVGITSWRQFPNHGPTPLPQVGTHVKEDSMGKSGNIGHPGFPWSSKIWTRWDGIWSSAQLRVHG